jgi:gamma-butyrobetaine dioxygenase
MIQLIWEDGSRNLFPFIWLRDNDPQGFHPQTLERQFDIASVDVLDSIDSAEIQGDRLVLHWMHENHSASYALQWLRDNQPGMSLNDPADFPVRLWRNELQQQGVASSSAANILIDDVALLSWMRDTQSYGLSIVDNIADASHAGMDIAKRVGFLRETNFGVEFEVKSKPNPNNLAYTSSELPLHTDLTNQEVPPGYQFLHCLANEAEGGQSVFCDGFAVAADLRESNPEAFEILATVSIPFRFQDEEYDIRSRKTVINVDENGVVYEICFNTHIAGIFDLAPEIMETYYLAYQAYKRLTQQDKYQIKIKLNAGEMAVFDNRRVLHGRTAFDPNTGYRHLQGCYVDRGEFESRLRMLSSA